MRERGCEEFFEGREVREPEKKNEKKKNKKKNKKKKRCDFCDDWFHASCVGLTEPQASRIDVYKCPRCDPMQTTQNQRELMVAAAAAAQQAANNRARPPRAYGNDSFLFGKEYELESKATTYDFAHLCMSLNEYFSSGDDDSDGFMTSDEEEDNNNYQNGNGNGNASSSAGKIKKEKKQKQNESKS